MPLNQHFWQKNWQIAQKLNLRNLAYRKFTQNFLDLLYQADLQTQDVTTALLKNPHAQVRAEIWAKEPGMVAGLAEIEFWLKTQKIQTTWAQKDGELCTRNSCVARLRGTAQNLLQTERTALNLLQRMSGIATQSYHLAQKIGKYRFAVTRKTLASYLDRRAAFLGGALPYRLGLFDQIFLKENHLALEPQLYRKIPRAKFVTLEVPTARLAQEFVRQLEGCQKLILLLDNFTVAQLKRLIPILRKLNSALILEASGGITPKNAVQFLATGVDFVSLGCLTHSAPALDFSWRLLKG